MMKILSVCLSLIMLLSLVGGAFPVQAAEQNPLIGDVDGDGEVTVSDALLVLRICAQLEEFDESKIEVYDVWSDGEVGMEDALGILRSSVELIGSFGRTGVEFKFTPNEAAKTYGLNQDMVDRGILSSEGTSRIAKVMDKAAAGEDISIVTLGGSITAGSSATAEANRYANVVTSWWDDNFPKAKVTLRNSGIGASGSLFGVFRLERDVFAYNPDLLIVEYAVNDTSAGTAETYENLIRQVLTKSPDTAIIMLFMTDMYYNDMQAEQIPIGEHYKIPMISYRNAIKGEIEAGNVTWPEISPDIDGLHPNDRGHRLVGGLVNSYLDGVKRVYEDSSRIIPEVPASINGERFQNTTMYLADGDLEIESFGSWDVNSYGFYDYTRVWYNKNGTRPMTFEVRARDIYILYERDVNQYNSGEIKITVDRKANTTVDSYFENGWGNYIEVVPVFTGSATKKHDVRIALQSGAFKLVGILVTDY